MSSRWFEARQMDTSSKFSPRRHVIQDLRFCSEPCLVKIMGTCYCVKMEKHFSGPPSARRSTCCGIMRKISNWEWRCSTLIPWLPTIALEIWSCNSCFRTYLLHELHWVRSTSYIRRYNCDKNVASLIDLASCCTHSFASWTLRRFICLSFVSRSDFLYFVALNP